MRGVTGYLLTGVMILGAVVLLVFHHARDDGVADDLPVDEPRAADTGARVHGGTSPGSLPDGLSARAATELGSAPAPPSSGFTVTGELRLPDGLPLGGVALAFQPEGPMVGEAPPAGVELGWTVSTDASGKFEVEGVVPGRYRPALARHDRLVVEPDWIEVTGETAALLTVQAFALEVTVVAPWSEPVEGAVVQATVSRDWTSNGRASIAFERKSRTDAVGRVLFLQDQACRIDVLARAGNFEGSAQGLVLAHRRRMVSTTVVVSPPLESGSVRVRVENQLGADVRAFRVRIRDRRTREVVHVFGPDELDALGCMTGMSPGDYDFLLVGEYSINDPEYYTRGDWQERRAAVSSGEVTSLSFRVHEGGRIRVHCLSPFGAMAADERVRVSARPEGSDEGTVLWFLSGDEDALKRDATAPVSSGALSVMAFAEGRYALTAESDRYESDEVYCDVKVNRIEDIEIPLRIRQE